MDFYGESKSQVLNTTDFNCLLWQKQEAVNHLGSWKWAQVGDAIGVHVLKRRPAEECLITATELSSTLKSFHSYS